MKKIFKNLLLFAVVLSMAACVGRTKKQGAGETALQAPAAELVVVDISEARLLEGAADTLDLGYVSGGDKIDTTLLVRNTGDKPLVIIQDLKSCNCVTVAYSRKPIQPGETSEMTVEFDAKGLYGMTLKPVRFTTNLAEQEYSLVVTADVK